MSQRGKLTTWWWTQEGNSPHQKHHIPQGQPSGQMTMPGPLLAASSWWRAQFFGASETLLKSQTTRKNKRGKRRTKDEDMCQGQRKVR